MASLDITSHPASPAIPQTPLTGDPGNWPSAARNTHRQVVAQLDSWCRAHDESKMLNSWIAEEAVRQSW
jgi:hypothetical protein